MAALIAVDSRETMLRVAALEEPCDDICLDAAPEPAARLQFGRMPGSAFIERRRARLARPVYAASRGLRCMRTALHAPSNACRTPEGIRPA